MPREDPAPSQPQQIIIPTEKETIQRVTDKVKEIETARQPQSKQWLVNVAFLFGKHYFYVDKKSVGTTEERVVWELRNLTRKNKSRRVSNYILPLYRSMLARLMMMKGKVEAEPLTRAQRDIDAARVSQECLEDFWLNVNKSNALLCQRYASMQGVLGKLFGYMLATGQAYLKPYFNPKAMARAVFRSMEGAVETIDDYEIGAVETEVLHSFECYPDPLGRSFTQKRILDVDEIETLYGVKIKPQSVQITDIEQQLMSLMEQGTETSRKYENSAVVYEHYEHPTVKYPQGRFIVCTEDKVIEDTVIAQECKGRFPYFKFDYLDLMMCPYPQGMVEQLISLQEEYNFTVSRLSEYKKWFAGKIKVPKGCNLETKYDDEVGQYIIYDRTGGEPQFEVPPNPPAFLMEELNRIRRDMEDIAATHDVSMSRTPTGIKSGIAIENLTELDNGQITPLLMHAESQLSFFCEMVLDIIEMRYSEERLLGITGDTLTAEVKTFKGEQVRGNKRIKITLGSGLPTSKAARVEFILRLKAEGLLTPEKVIELLEFGDLEGVFHSVDENVQKTEIQELITSGIPPMLNDWDNHTVHLAVLDKFLKSEQFKALEDPIKNALIIHRQEHQQALSAEFQAANSVGQTAEPMAPPMPPQG